MSRMLLMTRHEIPRCKLKLIPVEECCNDKKDVLMYKQAININCNITHPAIVK